MIELAGEINREMPVWVVTKIAEALNEREKSLKGSRIFALGLSYNRHVDDTRKSPSVRVMESLRARGAIVAYSDPYAPTVPVMREHKFDLSSAELTPKTLASFVVVVLLTDHSNVDYDLILQNASLIIDMRGKYRAFYVSVVKS